MHSPNFHIHLPMSDLYIPTIDLPILLQEIRRPILEYINRSQTLECGNWDWGRAIPRKGTHICVWFNICAFPHILGSPSSYMSLQLLHSEFPCIWGKFGFLFYQCGMLALFLIYVEQTWVHTVPYEPRRTLKERSFSIQGSWANTALMSPRLNNMCPSRPKTAWL